MSNQCHSDSPADQTPDRPCVFVADDEEPFREIINEILVREGCDVCCYDPLAPDQSLFKRRYDVAILDMIMPHASGFELRRRILEHSPDAQFVIITGFPDRDMLAQATELGVFSFLTKPFTKDHIKYAVMGALHVRTLLKQSVESARRLSSEKGELVGVSEAMEAVRRQIMEIARHELPALITGESGTGKEVVARCIHQCSARRDKPFVAVNCGALSPSLFESELFGHAQGSFTGAIRTKHGYVEAANGGTLFLDEVGELPPELQTKLLRVLDTGEYCRVGETTARRADIRIVSATNRDVEHMVKQGLFRLDLYYRLRGGRIHLIPLRDRPEDILPLAVHFLGGDRPVFSPEAADILADAPWPGNCRELAMTVALIKSRVTGAIISAETVRACLCPIAQDQSKPHAAPGSALNFNDFRERELIARERRYFEQILSMSDGNISRAAALAAIDRKSFYRKLDQLGIRQRENAAQCHTTTSPGSA